MPSVFSLQPSAAAAAATFAFTATSLAADGVPPPDAIRAARDRVAERPEFHYAPPPGRSFLDAWTDLVGSFFSAHPHLYWVVMAVLALFALILLVHVMWTLRVARRATWETDLSAELEAAMRRGDAGPFRARAIEHADAARFDEAVRDLYAALLLTLDRREVVRYAAHKALLDYRIEASLDAGALRALDEFARSYHPGSFGRRPPDRRRFDELLAILDAQTTRPQP